MEFISKILKYSLFSMLCVCSQSFAIDELTPNRLFPHPRALAMGDAMLSMPQMGHGVFYNPAAIATTRRATLEANNITIHGSSRTFTGLSPSNFESDTFNLNGKATILRTNDGGSLYQDFGIFPHFAARNFVVGVLYRDQADAYAPTDEGERLTYSKRTDLAGIMGLGFSMFHGLLRFGVTGRSLYRVETPETTVADTATTTNLSYDTNSRSGSIVNGDAGVQLVIPFDFLPTFSFVSRNLAETKFTQGDTPVGNGATTTAPSDMEERTDVGFSISPWVGKRTKLRITADYVDINEETTMREGLRVRGGIELDFHSSVFLRGGYIDENYSYGIGLNTKKASIDISTYAIRRINTYNTTDIDQRYVFRFTLRPF